MSASVVADQLGVRFQFDRQRRPMTPAAARIRRHTTDGWGLHGVDLRVRAGEGVALMGSNGAGKTTLLRTVAGVLAPDEGHLDVRGRVGPLLSVDAGLLPLLTGRESSRLLGVLAGLGRVESRLVLEEVKQRSALGDSFERPVSSYSQGMRARLGFATVEQIRPEILLLDEVHEALDHEFRETVEARVREILGAGGIVLAAGHDHGALAGLCQRAILLDRGRVVLDGPFADVARCYIDRLDQGADERPDPSRSLR